jgi:Protein of unknown function (DUF3072)
VGLRRSPDDWRTGVVSENLCEQAGTPELYDDNLTKAEASKLIDEMREKADVK